jgi:pyruvate,water dikinase
MGRYGRIKTQADRFIKHHNRRLDRFRQKDLSAKRLEELYKLSLILRIQHGQTQLYMWITAMNMLVRKKLLAHLLERYVPEVTTHQLLSGLIGLKSLEPNNRMKRMATYADRLTPEDQKILLDGDDQSIRCRLRQRPSGHKLLLEFDDFMRRYGFLSSSGTDFTVSPWVENPNLIWKGIGRLATSGTYGHAPDTEITRKRSLKRVCSQLQLPPRWIFRRLLRSTREHVRLRERISLLMSEDVYHMRRLYLAIGEQLVINGKLSQRDDIFHLSSQELASAIDNSGDEDLLKKKIVERKTALKADAAIDMEDVFYGEPHQWPTSPGPITGQHLEGIIGSMGLAQGCARIVNNPSEIGTPLTKRDILIVPHTDVGWTPLFPSIGGIVAETGGQLSHSAIIAREYGLPAVVSVRKATRIIRDGQSITVDGNRGRVYLGHIHRKKEQAR